MENIDTVSIRISNKQISSIIDDSITRTTSLKKSSIYLSDIRSFKSEKLQSLVSRIANDQTAKLVNSETSGIRELSVTRSFASNVMYILPCFVKYHDSTSRRKGSKEFLLVINDTDRSFITIRGFERPKWVFSISCKNFDSLVANYVLFRPRQKCLTYNPSINVYDPAINALSTLEKKDFVKYLGALIDYELSWKNHINLICLKISRTVGIVAKLRHSIPLRPLLNIYQALINPYLYYGICAWGSAPKTYLNKILLIQKRALRLIYFTDYKQHAVPFFLKSKVFPLSFI